MAEQLLLQLDGFDGPLDLLLELARKDKVDLGRISILSLVEQFLLAVEGVSGDGAVRLELAADWLVMAAWLTWLKSRLLLPPEAEGAAEGEAAAGDLAERLDALAAVQAGARWLGERPRLGETVFARGMPETLVAVDRSGVKAALPDLLRAYLAAVRRGAGSRRYAPRRPSLPTLGEALERLRRMLGDVGGWAALEHFLPRLGPDPLQRRGAMAATLLASLELAREGTVVLRQQAAFGAIHLRAETGDG